jgi:hypothetical protein
MHVTGITETDIMDDFLRQSLIPFISERIPIDSNNAIPRPGKLLADEGASAKHPVFLVPGFITTGLEVRMGEGRSDELLPAALALYLSSVLIPSRFASLIAVVAGGGLREAVFPPTNVGEHDHGAELLNR